MPKNKKKSKSRKGAKRARTSSPEFETDVEQQVESKADDASETLVKPKGDDASESQLKPKADDASEQQLEPKGDNASESQLKPKADDAPKPQLKPKAADAPEPQLKPKADDAPEPQLEPKADDASEPQLEPKADGAPKPQLKPKADESELEPAQQILIVELVKPGEDRKESPLGAQFEDISDPSDDSDDDGPDGNAETEPAFNELDGVAKMAKPIEHGVFGIQLPDIVLSKANKGNPKPSIPGKRIIERSQSWPPLDPVDMHTYQKRRTSLI